MEDNLNLTNVLIIRRHYKLKEIEYDFWNEKISLTVWWLDF